MRDRAFDAAPDERSLTEILEALDASALRAVVRDMLPWLDRRTHAQCFDRLREEAARNASAGAPNGPTAAVVREAVDFAHAAAGAGEVEPEDADAYLWVGSQAFLARDFAAAVQIFDALLMPIGRCEIDLGQREMVGEVFTIDVEHCASQYVVAT